MGLVDFTKLLYALSSFAQPFNRVISISEHFFVILSLRRTFSKRNRRKKNKSGNKWPPGRLLFIRLEIVFVTISPLPNERKLFTKCFKKDNVG